eukprot:353496-Chlamydomonas_euryale.AAC.2
MQLLRLLDAATPGAVADVVGGALSATDSARLQLLRAAALPARLALAQRVADAAVAALRARGAAGSAGGNGAAAVSKRLLQLNGGGSARSASGSSSGSGNRAARAPGGNGDDGDGEGDGGGDGEIAALLARLARSCPPPEVAAAASKEARRVEAMGEASPGHAAARAYLEALCELPWRRYGLGVANLEGWGRYCWFVEGQAGRGKAWRRRRTLRCCAGDVEAVPTGLRM